MVEGKTREGDMTKREFLEKLRQALNGRMSSGTVADNLQYYEDYINTEIRKGRTEEEVLFELGQLSDTLRLLLHNRQERCVCFLCISGGTFLANRFNLYSVV